MLANTTSLDTATAIVAGYAALVGTVAAAFQAFSWWRSWQTRVIVRVHPKMQMMEPGDTPVPAVVFKLINHSGHPVKITHLGTDPLKKGGHHVWFPHPHGLVVSGVFEIPARDAVTVWQPPASFIDGDPNWKTRAKVTTSDDKTFKSRKLRVGDMMATE